MALLAALVPLLQTGACVDLVIRSAINGFFDGVTPLLDEALADVLTAASGGENDSAASPP